MQNELPPKILYQYRPPEAWALDNLCRQVMYFGSPENFNDPYDCRTPPTFRDLTDEQLAAVMRMVKGDAETLPRAISLLSPKPVRDELIRQANGMFRNEYTKLCEQFGVSCFSERWDNLRMWSQYGGHGKGFCLAFDTGDKSLFPLDMVIRVQYSEHWPDTADAIELLKRRKPARAFLAHKSKDWEYEKEWRLLGARGNEKRYDEKTLKAVYFGTECAKGTKENVRLIVQEKYPHAELQSCEVHASEYKVDLIPMSRDSHK